MNVTLTNNQILMGLAHLQNIPRLQLKAKPGYSMGRNQRKLRQALDDYNAERERLLEKYGVEKEGNQWKIDDQGNVIFPDDESRKKAIEELNDLLEIEVEVDLRIIKLDDLDNVELPWSIFDVLEWMFDESDES